MHCQAPHLLHDPRNQNCLVQGTSESKHDGLEPHGIIRSALSKARGIATLQATNIYTLCLNVLLSQLHPVASKAQELLRYYLLWQQLTLKIPILALQLSNKSSQHWFLMSRHEWLLSYTPQPTTPMIAPCMPKPWSGTCKSIYPACSATSCSHTGNSLPFPRFPCGGMEGWCGQHCKVQ